MIYSSIQNSKIKDIKKLNQKKYRDESGLFLVDGEHLVLEAYKCGSLVSVILEEHEDIDLDIDKIYVTDSVMNYISNLDNHQKIMGICKKIETKELTSRIIVLDGIQDPGNLGTIIRSAKAFNFDTIVLSLDTVDLYNSKVIRASQGLIFHENIITCDIKSFIKDIKDKGYTIVGTKVDNGTDIRDIKNISSLALIMGNEGNGVSAEVLDMCDLYAHIKMNDNCESLNVGVATSIMMYELSK